ncbi:MAG TPA: hypothetical protein PKJ84_16325 [Anaerolineales bacterium]|nr:hypothetical protein [Anaerolineales bacterium]
MEKATKKDNRVVTEKVNKIMVHIIVQIEIVIFTGILFSAIGIWCRKILVRNGVAQDRLWDIILYAFMLVAIAQIWFPSLSWKWVALIELAGVVFGANRMDVWYASNKGKFWWKKDVHEND